MISRRQCICAIALSLIVFYPVAGESQETPVKPLEKSELVPVVSGVVDQRDYPDSANGCAPASILNLLKFSGPEYMQAYQKLMGPNDGLRMRFIVDRYFKNRPSVVYPGQERWGFHGVQSADLVTGLNAFLKDNGIKPLKGTYLDRDPKEEISNHIVRVHDLISASIMNDVSPILSLRSFIVQRREENGNKPVWETGYHHNVVVTKVSSPLSATGFELAVLEPYRGKKTNIYIHPESSGLPFIALKGIQENGIWLKGEPFLLVLARDLPTLRPRDVEWDDRYVVVANFLIGAF